MNRLSIRFVVIVLLLFFIGQTQISSGKFLESALPENIQSPKTDLGTGLSLIKYSQSVSDTLVFSDDFSSSKAWIDQSSGLITRDSENQWLNWESRRDTPTRYFIPINITSDYARLEFRFNVTNAAGNGGINFGLAETLDAPNPIWGVDATGFFVALNRDTAHGTKVAMISMFADGGFSGVDSEASILNYGSLNTWCRLRVVIDQGNWTITLLDNSGVQMSEVSGTLPQQHSVYRYLFMTLEGTSGWEWATGYLDNMAVYGTASTDVLFSDDFSTQKPWVNETSGHFYRDATNEWLVWQTFRDETRRYYIPLPAFSARETIRLRFRVKVNSANGNGSVGVGLFESLSGAFNQTSAPVGFNMHISHNTIGIDHVYPWVTYSDRGLYGSWIENDPSTYTNLQAMGVWRRVELSIQNLSWTIAAYDDNGIFLDDLSGTLPQAHNLYRYLMVFMDYYGGWETQAGYLDDIELEVSKPVGLGSTVVEEFDSSDGFTTTSPNVTIFGGLANWNVSRSPAGYQQYVYRNFPEITGDVRLTVRGRIDSATNNCGVNAGIGTQPGNGVAVTFGYTGGGCSTNGPVIMGRGVTLDYQEEPPGCVYTGNWLWVNYNTMYTAVLNVSGGAATLGVDGLGSATGTSQYNGPFNTLYVGLTGDGDWPSCSGVIDSITVEPLTGDRTPPAAITDLTAATASGSGEVTLNWTAPGDDGSNGRPSSYQIRYSTLPIDTANWNTATLLPNPPAPGFAGTYQSYLATLPAEGTTYYLAIKALDDASNSSTLSNVVEVISGPLPPASSYIEEFNSSAGFTSTTPNITISGGRVNWNVSRNPAGFQQYIYRSIPHLSGDVRLTVRGRIDNATNNCGVKAGIGDAPGSGVSVIFGYTGGGCATNGPVIMANGAEMDYQELPPGCVYAGNWLWVSYNNDYTATLSLTGNNVGLSVPGIGTTYGTRFYNGHFDTLYVGLTGDGDWPSCTGSIDSITIEGISDITPPEAVSNLSASSTSEPGQILLDWTAPGGDGSSGTAAGYDMRYSPAFITAENWDAATPLSGEPAPASAGTHQSMLVTLPYPGQTYYFGLKSIDTVSNLSDLSNIAIAASVIPGDNVRPQRITNLVARTSTSAGQVILTWTATGDDGVVGTAHHYRVRYSEQPITSANWSSAIDVSGEPSPKVSGELETMTLTLPTPGQSYYVGLRVYDEANNSPEMSAAGPVIAYSVPLADLEIVQLTADKTSAMPGATVQVSFRGKNSGDATATTHYYTVYLESSANGTPVNEKCNRGVSSLPAGQEEPITCNVTIPTNQTAGDYYFVVIADRLDLVNEKNPNNNRQSVAIQVTNPSPTSPFDLTIKGVEVTQGIQIYRLDNPNYHDPAYGTHPSSDATDWNWTSQGPGNNEVRLVNGRNTIVRVYVDLNLCPANPFKVTGRLTYTGDSGSRTITPMNGSIDVQGQTIDREDSNMSLNFLIPGGQLDNVSSLSFSVEIDPDDLIAEMVNDNNSFSQNLSLKKTDHLTVGFAPVQMLMDGRDRGTGVVMRTVAENLNFARATLPLPNWIDEVYIHSIFPYKFDSDACKSDLATTQLLDQLEAYKAHFPNVDVIVGVFPMSITDVCEAFERSDNTLLGRALDIGFGHAIILNDLNYQWGDLSEYRTGVLAHELSHLIPGLTHPLSSWMIWDDSTCGARDPSPRWPYGSDFTLNEVGMSIVNFTWRDDEDNPLSVSRGNTIWSDDMLDLMSYCYRRWTSPWSWEAWVSKSSPSNQTQVMSMPSASLYYLLMGSVYQNGVAEFNPVWTSPVQVLAQKAGGDYCVESLGGGGETLAQACYAPDFLDDESGAPVQAESFLLSLPFDPTATSIRLVHQGNILKSISASAAPTVTLNYPNGGENLSEDFTISWTGFDPNSDPLYYRVFYSQDDGVSWLLLASNLTGNTLPIQFATLPGSSIARFKVEVSDGFNTAEDISDVVFTVSGKPPQVFINPTLTGADFLQGTPVSLIGSASDGEDGPLTEAALSWSSDVDGMLGTGEELVPSSLSPGVHKITLTATDSNSMTAYQTVTIEILTDADADGLPDRWEAESGLDPATGDSELDPDGDGLVNRLEYLHGTDPHNPDSDFNGTDDFSEVFGQQSPLELGPKLYLPITVK